MTIDVGSVMTGIGIGVGVFVVTSQWKINKEVIKLMAQFDMLKEGIKNLGDLETYFKRQRKLESIVEVILKDKNIKGVEL